MRTIERRFNKIKAENENKSDYICLSQAVRGQKFKYRTLYRYFNQLMDPSDYRKDEVKGLVRFLHNVSKQSEDCTSEGKNAPGASQIDRDESVIKSPIFGIDISRNSAKFVVR